jgi:hypothetical protein
MFKNSSNLEFSPIEVAVIEGNGTKFPPVANAAQRPNAGPPLFEDGVKNPLAKTVIA